MLVKTNIKLVLQDQPIRIYETLNFVESLVQIQGNQAVQLFAELQIIQ